MTKKGQSILDFLNSLPLDILQAVPRAPVNDHEAQALYNIWKSGKDEYGRSLVPDTVDPLQVAALTSKGMVKSQPISLNGTKVVDITAKGTEIIRNIILHSEESVFEKQSQRIDYESIHNSVVSGSKKKIASSVSNSWLKKVAVEYTDIAHGERGKIKDIQILWSHNGNRLMDVEESEPDSNHYELWGGTDLVAWGRVDTATKQGSFAYNNQYDGRGWKQRPRSLPKIIRDIVSSYPGIRFTVFPPEGNSMDLQNFWEKNIGH